MGVSCVNMQNLLLANHADTQLLLKCVQNTYMPWHRCARAADTGAALQTSVPPSTSTASTSHHLCIAVLQLFQQVRRISNCHHQWLLMNLRRETQLARHIPHLALLQTPQLRLPQTSTVAATKRQRGCMCP